MKKLFIILKCSVLFLLVQASVYAQDSTQTGAIKQIQKTSEQSDKLYGKKIQKQSLSTKTFESPGTVAAVHKTNKLKNKGCKKHKRRHH